jgi:membrane-associated protease RseP (regulator of RpoE activity)
VWESPRVDNTTHPVFDVGPEKNLALDRNTRIRLELWDKDGVSSEPIGVYEGRALGEAIMDAPMTIKLEGGATVTVRVEHPTPLLGTGIAQYEVRKRAMVVLKVVPNSPASRAGVKPGDRITAIDGKLVDELGGGRAESALAQAGQNGSELTVEKDGKYRRVKLDDGYVWLAL